MSFSCIFSVSHTDARMEGKLWVLAGSGTEGYCIRKFAGRELELKILLEASCTFAVKQPLVPCLLSLLCPTPGSQRASLVLVNIAHWICSLPGFLSLNLYRRYRIYASKSDSIDTHEHPLCSRRPSGVWGCGHECDGFRFTGESAAVWFVCRSVGHRGEENNARGWGGSLAESGRVDDGWVGFWKWVKGGRASWGLTRVAWTREESVSAPTFIQWVQVNSTPKNVPGWARY